MIVMGLQKPGNDETNKEDELSVISAVAKEARIGKDGFRKHFDKVHFIGGAKKRKPRENYNIYYT